MKICFVDFGFYTPYSVLTPLYEYSQKLSSKDFHITIFVRRHKENIANMDRLTIRTPCREYLWTKLTHIIFLIRLVFILRKERFDIIHVFDFPGVALLPFFCKGRQGKWIFDIQTGLDAGRLKNFVCDRLTVFEAKYFDKIAILSNGLKDKLFGKRASRNIFIIPLGTNIERFMGARKDRTIWRKHGLLEKSIIMVYIGDLGKARKLENMLRAFRIVVEKKNNESINLVIFGGETKEIERLRCKAKEISVCNHVLFMGKVPYESIPTYLVNADIGLAYIPKGKIYDVQPPLKTFEYLAASLPVVATNTLGNLEIIKDGINGVITSDNYQDFAEGVLRLLDDPRLRSKVKHNAADSITEYDWARIIERLMQFYCIT